jgi:hypothetical protein
MLVKTVEVKNILRLRSNWGALVAVTVGSKKFRPTTDLPCNGTSFTLYNIAGTENPQE